MRAFVSKTALITALSAAMTVCAVPAFASDIVVSDFIGKIVIETGSQSLDVIRDHKELQASSRGDTITINGGFSDPDREKEVCSYNSGLKISWSINGNESWDKRLKDYPELRINVPDGSELRIKNSYVRLINEADLGSADLKLSGCLPGSLGNIDDVKLSKQGSGDLDAKHIGQLDLQKTGSGDIVIERTERVKLSAAGSGDVEIDEIDGSAEIKKSGSGDVEIDDMNGSLSITKSGAGDIDVGSGSILELYLKKSGSGDADIDARIVNADVTSRGAGDTYLRSVSGELSSKISGSGDLDVGNR